jgi:hypothetical protein
VVSAAGLDEVRRLAPGILRAAGFRRSLSGVARLAGGSKKGVYRLACADGFSAVLYVWSADEDFWPDAEAEGTGVFAHASGLGLFLASSERLTAAGVRVPRVYLADASRALYPADIALVEDVRGGTLEELLSAGGPAALTVTERLGGMLGAMWEQRGARIGKVASVDGASSGLPSGLPSGSPLGLPLEASLGLPLEAPLGALSAEEVVLERALLQLAGAAERVPAIAGARARLDAMLRIRAAAIAPRARWSLIHGELGPDHVFIDDAGEPVVVDIEGAMYFDLEWEHVFLRLRFGRHYELLRADGLDEGRMSLYALALDLSLIEGPLRLLDGGFPDREPMLAIAGWAADRVLEAVRG